MQSPLSDTEHSHTLQTMSSFGPLSLSSRCTQCNAQQKENTRNLVVCIDGASNKNTNMGKLFANINLETTHDHPQQLACDPSEFRKRPKSMLKRVERALCDKLDIARSCDIKEIVKDAYGWLAQMYQEGDQIYLFGFSRGAYQVRVLAGMIHEVGLMRVPTEKEIGTAYDHFEAIRSGQPKTRQIARDFKNKSSWKDLRVHFVGVWDSVPVGTIRADDFLSTFQSSAPHACHFRHALALDERRLKFIPDYIHQMNPRTDDVKSKYIVTFPDVEHDASPANERRESTASDVGTDRSEGKKNRTTEIKEVWFAGSHSDIGGRNIPRMSYQAGNVSLLWMRREAAASGLVLKPTDLVWLPDDLDFGTTSSYSWGRRRIIIPGQKVHASILYANTYKPKASLGEGFDILDTEPDNQIWETGLFDDTAAHQLVTSLGGRQGVMPIRLDRLLFMLRFKEGRQCVRNVPDWEDQLMSVVRDRGCAPLVKLVTIVAYYAASCDSETPMSSASPDVELPQDIFDDAKESFCAILAAHNHRDGPRVVNLLSCLTNHKILREQILTQDVLEVLVKFFDVIINRRTENFGQAMDGLNCLLQCEDMQKTIIEKLGENSRLLRILKVNSSDSLAAALRMVVTLSRIPEARPLCSAAQSKIRELARKDKRGIGLLAVEILLALRDRDDELNIRDARALASALVHLNPDRHDLAVRGEQILRHLFGLDAEQLNQLQRNLIGELRGAVQKGNARKRTAATLTLLKLYGIIRTHLLQINLLDDFVNQLRRKDTALLAACALATCLKYSDMKDSMMKDNAKLPKNIVDMLRLDYFDDAVGQVEGFQIFGDLMQHVELREKIMTSNITKILSTKLAKGKSKETRTSLICLDIFRSFDRDGPWTSELVDESLKSLRKPEWTAQKAGVTILSALAQTKHGVAVIGPRIYEIVEMLLPEGYLPVRSTTTGDPASRTPPTNSGSSDPPPISRMMGPAFALRMLAQNKVLRDRTRKTMQYDSLKQLFLSGTLVGTASANPWEVETPRQTDITMMLDMVIKAVDDELSEEGLMSTGDAVLPHIRHWNDLRLLTMAVLPMLPLGLCYFPIALTLGVAGGALAFPFIIVSIPFALLWDRFQDSDIQDWLRGHPWSEREGEFDPDVHDGEGGSSGQRGEGSHGDNKVGAEGGGEVERTFLMTSP